MESWVFSHFGVLCSQHGVWGVQFSQHHLLWGLSFPSVCPWPPCRNLTDPPTPTPRVGWILGSLSRPSGPCACFCAISAPFGDCRFSAECEVRERDASSPVSFLRVALALRGPLRFHTNVRRICSVSVKNTLGISVGVTLTVYIALGSVDILAI